MTPEASTKSNPEEIARLARQTLQVLAETHIIIEKEEFQTLIDANLAEYDIHIWDLITSSYDKAAQELSGHVSVERQRGFELGGKLLKRMRDVAMEESDAIKGENTPKN